ncbi:MAG: hypothetical protein IPP33_06295 [Flavobacteriales bacterium]|nr:hypothetical protein [Flavobacteriales bacterium]
MPTIHIERLVPLSVQAIALNDVEVLITKHFSMDQRVERKNDLGAAHVVLENIGAVDTRADEFPD